MSLQSITHTVFMLVKTTNAWLALTPPERFAFVRTRLEPLLAAQPTLRMRYYDSEAFNARATDVLVWETRDLGAYQAIVEGLRETAFWGVYFDIVEILPAIENAYALHYDEAPVGG